MFAALCLMLVLATRSSAAAASPAHVAAHFAIADFDGDSRPDLASVDASQGNSRITRYWIAFRLSGGPGSGVAITAPTGGLQITSRDVNGDSFPDVIVTTAWTNTPVAVLLNDGFGNFTTSSPSEFQNAFTTSETSWTFAANEIRDATALVLARYVPGDCRAECGCLSQEEIRRWIRPTSNFRLRLVSTTPFIGRAPPHL
jgi:hypothetical protein